MNELKTLIRYIKTSITYAAIRQTIIGAKEMKAVTAKVVVNSGLTLLACIFTLSAYAEITVTVGDPDKDGGKVKWEVTADNNKKFPIVITVPAGTTAIGKAKLLEDALKDKLFKVGRDGAAVTIKNAKKAEKLLDETFEKDKMAGLAPKKGTFDFHLFSGTLLAGIDQDGLESQFQAALGFDGVFADAIFNFSDLSGNTIDALLTDTYNDLLVDLPAAYWSGLSLDLSNDVIEFAFPTASQGFVENFTSDSNAFTTLSLETTVPEPSILSLIVIGAAGFGFLRSRKYKVPAVNTKSA